MVGSLDDPLTGAAGGLLAGAVIGAAQALALGTGLRFAGYTAAASGSRSASLGIVIGPALMLCSLEFVGREHGWKLAERLTPPAYVAWSLWLIATGIAFL